MSWIMIKKEFKEGLYESKGLWMIAAASWILTALCFIVVNIKEGSVLAQTDILQYAMKAILFLTLMISMVLGASGFASEREQNTLESLLLTPVPVKTLAMAKYLGILLIGVALYLVSMPYLFVIGIGSGTTVNAVIITALTGILLELAFVAISLVLSIIMQSTKGAILMAILILAFISFPGILHSLLKQSPKGLLIMKIDPVSSAFTIMKSVLTDRNPLSDQIVQVIPLLVFVAVSLLLLAWAARGISLKGEK